MSYTYGANGELAARTDALGTTTYTYDALGNLRNAQRPVPAATIEYVIDGQNRRVGKKVGGVLQQAFLYDEADRIIAELDGAGNVVSRFVYGARPHVPEYMIKNGTTYRLVTDHLGSVRLVVEVNAASLTIAQRFDFDPWGQITFSQSPGFQPFGFAGGLYDPDTGLVRFGARDYDPAVGRWTAKDPIGFSGGDANLYAYVANDPVNLIDPSGAVSVSAIHTALDIAGLIPGVGEIFDVANAALYFAEGDCQSALLSLAAAIPAVGAAVIAGKVARRGVPKAYSVAFEARLTPRGIGTYDAHFVEANEQLLRSMSDPELANALRQTLGRNFEGTILSPSGRVLGSSPAGWTWHHVPDRPGVVQLVPRAQHAPGSEWQGLLHPGGQGGMTLWGRLY